MCRRWPNVLRVDLGGGFRLVAREAHRTIELPLPVHDPEPVGLQQTLIDARGAHGLPLPDQVIEDRTRLVGCRRLAVHRGARQSSAAEAPARAASEMPAAAPSAPSRRRACEDVLCRFLIAP